MNYADRIKQPSSSVGTGAFVLETVPVGYRAFAQVYTSTQRFLYVIQNAASGEWEVGYGYVTGGTLTRETPIEGSSSLPVSFGAGTKDVFVADPAVLSQSEHAALFGTGYQGDLVVNAGTTSLGNNAEYRNVTISGTGVLDLNGYTLKVSGVLDMRSAQSESIIAVGGDGADAAVGVRGTGATGARGRGVGAGGDGTDGISGTTGAGSTATATADQRPSNGGEGGISGAGGNGGATAGGGTTSAGATLDPIFPALRDPLIGYTGTVLRPINGGSGSPGGSSGGGGGGGAGGGGIIDIACAVLKVDDGNTVQGAISARGGRGGTGGTPAGGNRGGGGGAAGGGGGYVRLVIGHTLGSRTNMVTTRGGTGGVGGSKQGTGVAGQGGDGGEGGQVDVFKLSSFSRVRTVGVAGDLHSGQSPGGGGACYGDV